MELDTSRSLYNPEDYENCLTRIDQLSAESKPQWGSMTAAQMLSHCAEIQEVSNGKELKGTPFIAKLFKGMIRKMVVNEKPYKKSTQTHPQYRQTEERDFETEKARLLAALKSFIGAENSPGHPHPLFGTMTHDEKGWSAYKHLDHHLTQFGV